MEAELDAHVVHLDDGRVRLRDRGRDHPRGLPARADGRRRRHGGRAGDPLPGQPGERLPPDEDQDQLAFYNRNDELRITDLHQGIVWGTQTEETRRDERLINRFDYDGDYGTVLNRFLMQAAIGYPLTVHGTGGQTRAFIHIQDTVRCIRLAVEHPPRRGERVRIFNQMTETHRVIELAELVSELTGAPIDLVDNPRKEASDNELVADNSQLLNLGLQPTRLATDLREVTEIAERYLHRCDRDKIPCRSRWVRERERLARSTAGTATVTR